MRQNTNSMKQKILLCSVCLCLLFACKKDKKAPDPSAKLYPISVNVSGFSQSQVPTDGIAKTKTLATQATDPIPVQTIYYMLIKGTGANIDLVSMRHVNKGDPNFTQFNDNVPAGDYSVVFFGGSSNLTPHDAFPIPYFNYFLDYTSGGTLYWDDTFFKRVPFTVTNTGVNLAVEIPRVTARLVVVLKDAIPAGVTKIVVSFPDANAYGINGPRTLPAVPSTTNTSTSIIKSTDIGTQNYTIAMNTLHDTTPFDVTISYYGSNQTGPLGTKTVKNVVCKTNTQTILSGNLFTQDNGQFQITVDQDWNAPVNVNF